MPKNMPPAVTPHAQVIYDDLGFRDYKETWDYQERFFNAKVKEKGGSEWR